MTKPEKYLIYTAKQLKAVATRTNEVLIELELPDAGLMPGVALAFRMRPSEAREVAMLLFRKADEAESAPRRK